MGSMCTFSKVKFSNYCLAKPLVQNGCCLPNSRLVPDWPQKSNATAPLLTKVTAGMSATKTGISKN